jgi:membrane protein
MAGAFIGMATSPRPGEHKRPPSLLGAVATVVAAAALSALLTPKVEERVTLNAESPGQDRGRTARSPWQISWRGWKDILWRTYREFQDDRLLAISAGVVFFALLALFPAVTAIVSLYGLFAQPATISEHIGLISAFAPDQLVRIVEEQIKRLVSRDNAQLGFGVILGIAIAIWSANAGMKAIIDALNVVYEEQEKRSFVRLNLISLAFTTGAVAAVLFAIGAVVVAPLLLDRIGFGSVAEGLIEYGRWPALIVTILSGLALLYRFGPSRTKAKWRWLSVGSIVAALLWIAGSAVLSYYIGNYANYDATYGSLGTGIGLMMWLWVSTIAILFGAELNAEIEHQTATDTTRGRQKPMGARGATMADTVGESYS